MGTKTFHRGISDLKMAVWLDENDYGAFYDVLGARTMTLTWTIDTDVLRGDDEDLERWAQITSASLAIEEASVDLELTSMFMGGAFSTNAEYDKWQLNGGEQLPFVALAGMVKGSRGHGLQVFMPKAQMSDSLTMGAALDSWMIPATTFTGIKEGAINGLLQLIKYNEATALEIPPRATGGFA